VSQTEGEIIQHKTIGSAVDINSIAQREALGENDGLSIPLQPNNKTCSRNQTIHVKHILDKPQIEGSRLHEEWFDSESMENI